MKALRNAILAATFIPTACASPLGSSNYDAMTCADLNIAMSDASKAVTQAAIARGNIDHASIPFWVPGGARAVSALKNRQTRQIERLQDQEAVIEAARKQRCE